MSYTIDTFLSNVSQNSGDTKDVEGSLKFLQDQIKNKNIKLGKRDIKNIIITFYEESSKYPELNHFWGRYTNIIQYNNKEVRRLIVRDLVEKDVKRNTPCPHRVLSLIFQDREMIKLIGDPKTYLQAALQVKELCPDYLNYLGGDSTTGKSFRKTLGDLVGDSWRSLMYPDCEEGVSKSIEGVIKYIGVNPTKLHKVEDCDIVANFDNLRKVWYNINIDAVLSKDEKAYFSHNKVVFKNNTFNITKLMTDYEKKKIKEELLLEHIFSMMLYEEKRVEILNYLKSKNRKLYFLFNDMKFDNDLVIGTIPKEIFKFCEQGHYPSTIIKPTIGDTYYSYEKSTLFLNCDPQLCSATCDKSSHHEWFKMTLIEDDETALKMYEELQKRADGEDQVVFMDIKTSIKDTSEEVIYMNVFFPKWKLISFNLERIDNAKTKSFIVDLFFSTKKFQIFCYNWKEMKQKLSETFAEVFHITRGANFPFSTVVCLLNRLNLLVEASGIECSIPKYFPNTWKLAYRYDSIDYSNDDNDVERFEDNEEFITKQQRKCIRNMSLNMKFRNLCYLTTSYDYDESESFPYSFWHRKPLRKEQKEEMMTRLIAMYDIIFHLNTTMSKDPEYNGIACPIIKVRVKNSN